MINLILGDLLEKDNSVSIHHKNLQGLAIEMFKIHTKTSPEIMQEVFLVKEHGCYNLQFFNTSG